MYVREYPWCYFNSAEKGYKYKKCELFPATGSRNNQHKFAKEAVKSLTNYPRHLLENHNNFAKYQSAVKEDKGM